MTEFPPTTGPDEIDVDPYADDTGRVAAPFAAIVGDDVAALLADASMWDDPPNGLADRILDGAGADTAASATVLTERTRDGADTPDALAVRSLPTRPTSEAENEQSRPPRRWRRSVTPIVLGSAAAVAALLGGIVLLSAISGNPSPPAFAAPLIPTGLIADVEGDVEITPSASGLEIALDAPSLPRRAAGEFYEGWLRLDDGGLVPAGTFHEGAGVTLWAGIEFESVVGFTITLERAVAADSSEQASSDQVVLRVDLPRP